MYPLFRIRRTRRNTTIRPKAETDKVFARIIPQNDHALLHFDDIVEKMHHGSYKHQQNFVDMDTHKVPFGVATSHTDNKFTEGTNDSSNPDVGRLIWRGGFILYLRPMPSLSRNKWCISKAVASDGSAEGEGKPPAQETSPAEFLLWDKTHRNNTNNNNNNNNERRPSAELFFEKKSGILAIRSRCEEKSQNLIVDGEDVSFGTRLLNSRIHELRFGRCTYTFEYQFGDPNFHEANFQSDKVRFFREKLKCPPPIPMTSASPAIAHPNIKKWVVHGVVSRGISGVVKAASKSPLQFCAVKTMVRKDIPTSLHIAEEIKIANYVRKLLVKEYCPYILKYREVHYDRKSRIWNKEGGPEEVHVLYSPLCNTNFKTMMFDKNFSYDHRIKLLHDVLQGIEWLHSHNLVHRDIKPENLGVVFYPKLRAIILDFGSMRKFEGEPFKPRPHHVGTPQYLAPEMEAVPYTEKVDIWALGVTAFKMFVSPELPWQRGCKGNPWQNDEHWKERVEVYYAAWNKLKERNKDPVVNDLIVKMLYWKPEFRTTAAEGCRHHCFDFEDEVGNNNNERRGQRKRKAFEELELGKKRR